MSCLSRVLLAGYNVMASFPDADQEVKICPAWMKQRHAASELQTTFGRYNVALQIW